ncbi:TPA: hypothetical protein QFF40_000296 [Enterococcus faecium]
MKIELTELELLYILAMLDVNGIEEEKAYAKFIRSLEAGLIDRLPRLPERSELIKKISRIRHICGVCEVLGSSGRVEFSHN